MRPSPLRARSRHRSTASTGDSFLARRGQTHRIVNAGPGRLYALCTMIPDDHFAALIRAGVPAELDAEDLAVLRRLA